MGSQREPTPARPCVPETATAVAERLRASVADAADANDANRSLTDGLVRQLRAAGAFRLLIPGRYGGLEAPLPDFLDALQVYAEADASTAWCISQGAVIGTTSVWLDEAQIRAIWSDPDACIANGPPGDCEAARRGDAWILNGRWGFSSGCRHATWMTGALKVRGSNRWVCAFVPQSAVRFHDTVSGVLAELEHQEAITDDQRIALRMAGAHVIREAAAALNLAYTAAGSTGIYRHHPLHRRFQDMNVITQHIQARMSYYGFVGRHLLGHPFIPGPMN